MGMLIDGTWRANEDRFMQDGAFHREASALRGEKPSSLADRLNAGEPLVLVASMSCPWSHRTLLVRAVKDLQQVPVVVAGGPRLEGYGLIEPHPLSVRGEGVKFVHELYSATDDRYSGRATVPLIWAPETESIISNSSATIARAFDLASGGSLVANCDPDEIHALHARIYNGLSNAVYRAGLAETQDAYDEAVDEVFSTLLWLETHLTDRRYLAGSTITEPDLFLFSTLCRFDLAYHSLFRCTRRRLTDYPALWAYARDLYALPAIAETVDFLAIREGYFLNDTSNNPHRILPEIPEIDWNEPQDRKALSHQDTCGLVD